MASNRGREDRRRADLLLAASEWLYAALLALYPRAFRERYAEEMRRDFADLSREGLEEGGGAELARVWGGAFSDLALTALRERGTVMPRSAYPPVGTRTAAMAVVAAVLVAATVAVASLAETPQYEASSTLLIGQERGLEGAGLEAEVEGLQQLTMTLAAAAQSRPTAEETIKRLELSTTPDAFLDHLEAEPVESTQFIELSYTDPDPQRARVVTNTVGAVLSEQVSEVGRNNNRITASLWERAPVPEEPVSPNPLRDGLLALVSGLLLFVGLVVALPRLVVSGVGWAAALWTTGALGLTASSSCMVPTGEISTMAGKEKELLEALGRHGKLTVAGVALETSLTVREADRMLSALAAKGHLQVTVEHGRLLYSL
jgi:capsular polysaccharide biosynthesis protein